MAKVLYFIVTFLESGLAVFGIRSAFEQPQYRVLGQLTEGVEIRSYGPSAVIETMADASDGEAFSRLFRYITGANRSSAMIAMTAPVEMHGMMARPATKPEDGADVMRFFLPKAMASDPPTPTDPRVRLATLPSRTVAVLRFSGRLDRTNVARHESTLLDIVARTGRKAEGAPYVMGYDPPFTIPFLRRNEVAVDVDA